MQRQIVGGKQGLRATSTLCAFFSCLITRNLEKKCVKIIFKTTCMLLTIKKKSSKRRPTAATEGLHL